MSLLIKHFYRFGEFSIDTDQRILLRDNKPVALAPKVFDTLLILVENGGQIVTKEELVNRLWPDTYVEEDNLTQNIRQLRKTLKDDARHPIYIETIARRGYRFIANVEEVLADTGTVNGHITQRIESADRQPPDAAITLSNAQQSSPPEASVIAKPASIGGSKKGLALGVVLVIVVACGSLLVWKLLTKQGGATGKTDGRNATAAALKFEKLTETGQSRQVAISPDGRYIAYTRHLKGKESLWLRQLATNTNVEIVPPGSLIYDIAFAHSGEYVYFVRREPNSLYRVSPLGGVPTKILEAQWGTFSISPDDRQIAFIRAINRQDGQRELSLLIANADGTGERTLLAGPPPDELDHPVWSPDGSAILCVQGNSGGGGQKERLIEVKVDDGTKKSLSPERFFHISKLAWLPDQSGLLMTARKKLEGNNQLWRVSYPGLETHQVTEDLFDYLDLSAAVGIDKAVTSQVTLNSDIWVGTGSEPQNLKKITQAMLYFAWTPDSRLVYMSTASGSKNLWIMKADGTEQKQLTNDAAWDYGPAVTPDNRYIVFSSNRSGSGQIWRMNLDGSNQIQLTDGAPKGYPAISPDGKWVLCNTTDDWHLWKVPIDGGEPVRLTDYFALRPAVSPGGEMIACQGRTAGEGQPELLLLPFAGGQPFKRFDFAPEYSRLQWTADGKALIYASERNGMRVLVKQPLEGGAPEEIMSFDEDRLFDFGYSFDGKFLAVTRGGWQHDIVLISNLNHF